MFRRKVSLLVVGLLIMILLLVSRSPAQAGSISPIFQDALLGVGLSSLPQDTRVVRDQYVSPAYGFPVVDGEGRLLARVEWLHETSPDEINDIALKLRKSFPNISIHRSSIAVDGRQAIMLSPVPGQVKLQSLSSQQRAVAQSAPSFLSSSPPPPTSLPLPTESKPGPPPGCVEPTLAPTPTVAAALPPSEWQEIVLPPPKGSEQIVPTGVPVPTVSIAIPKQWGFVNHPGVYLIGPGPSPLPMVVLGPSLPFAAGEEPIPQNMDEFAEALVRIYPKRYGGSARAERIAVGGHEGALLFPSQGEVCANLFIPLGGRYMWPTGLPSCLRFVMHRED